MQLAFNWAMSKSFGDFGGRKKGVNFRTNLVKFRVEKGLSLFVTHCYIWAFSGESQTQHEFGKTSPLILFDHVLIF